MWFIILICIFGLLVMLHIQTLIFINEHFLQYICALFELNHPN